MRRLAICLAPMVAASVVLWAASVAVAHGPCRCLDPPIAQPGQSVRLVSETLRGDAFRGEVVTRGWPAYKAIFNPRPSDLGIAPDHLASAYRPDAPTVTVLSRSRHKPTRKARFRVPKGPPPGLYMVLIWDGGEGGAHNTWDYLHVVDRDGQDGRGVVAQQDEPAKAAEGGRQTREDARELRRSTSWALVAGIGLAGVVLGAAGSRAASRRRS